MPILACAIFVKPSICNIVACTCVHDLGVRPIVTFFFLLVLKKKTTFSTRAKEVIPKKASQNSPNLRSDPHQTLFYYYLLVQLVFKPVFRVLEIRVRVRVRVVAVHISHSILVM